MMALRPNSNNTRIRKHQNHHHKKTSIFRYCCRTDYLLGGFIILAVFFSIISTWTVHQIPIDANSNNIVGNRIHSSSISDTMKEKKRPSSTPKQKKDDEKIKLSSNTEQQAQQQLEEEEDDNSVLYHFITSTECSSYNVWETLTQIHSAESVQQCGKFTWIISGCLPHDQLHHGKGKSGANSDILSSEVIQTKIDQHFPPIDKHTNEDCSRIRPELHFTPDYSNMTVYGGKYADGTIKRIFYNPKNGKEVRSTYGNRYVFNNKPNGLLHWAKQHEHDQNVPSNEVIVLIDPDFLFLTRFHLVHPGSSLKKGDDKKNTKTTKDSDLVFAGQPAAASYGLGAQWLDFNLTDICGPDSHCTNATSHDVNKYYSAGPPYIIHRSDVLPLATKWASLVPPTYDVYPLLYAEMYAYSMAAAHLQLKHNLINGLFTGCMVSWPNPSENKNIIKKSAELYRTELATELQAQKPQPQQDSSSKEERPASSCFLSPFPPPMLHYCNRYMVKTTDEMKKYGSNVTYFFFAKRRVEHDDVLACKNGRFLPFASSKEYEKMAGGDVDWR